MQYISTRNKKTAVSAAEAIAAGLSKDGGLYTPEKLPHLSREFFMDLLPLRYEQRAAKIMALFLDDFSSQELEEFSREAYAGRFDGSDPAPLHMCRARDFMSWSCGTARPVPLRIWHCRCCRIC